MHFEKEKKKKKKKKKLQRKKSSSSEDAEEEQVVVVKKRSTKTVMPSSYSKAATSSSSKQAPVQVDKSIKGLTLTKQDGKGVRVGVIHTRWNEEIVTSLTMACCEELEKNGVRADDITLEIVPGAFELPFAAKKMIETKRFDAVVCIGTLIKGDTMHFEYICESVSRAIMDLGLQSGIPVIFGVLTCLTEGQAKARSGLAKGHNHGVDWALAAIEMANFKEGLNK